MRPVKGAGTTSRVGGGEVGGAGGGPRTLVAEPCLKDAPWHPPVQQMGRRRVAQGMDCHDLEGYCQKRREGGG